MCDVSPEDDFADLWKKLWPWIKFLDEYEESMAGDDFLFPATRYTGFLSFICLLRGNEAANSS